MYCVSEITGHIGMLFCYLKFQKTKERQPLKFNLNGFNISLEASITGDTLQIMQVSALIKDLSCTN